jgi:hypothetical protein
MTAIAIWCNQERKYQPALWIAADTRITNGESTLIEHGAKIFSLPVVCRSAGPEGFFSITNYSYAYGFCFAGSTLLGQNTYLSLAPLLANLISHPGYIVPMSEVAKYIYLNVKLEFDQYKERFGANASLDIAIFGYCHFSNAFSIYHIHPTMESGMFTLMCEDHVDIKNEEFVYLGDNRKFMSEQISSAFKARPMPGRPISRAPRYVIQDVIDDMNYPTIGGDLQLGIADTFGFRPLTLCKPRVKGQSAAYISYLGRDISGNMATIGEAIIGGAAMA